jgi:hypothetical protein
MSLENIEEVMKKLEEAKRQLEGGIEAEEDECFCRFKSKGNK